MILDPFTERLLHIISELDGKDVRAEFRISELKKLVESSFSGDEDTINYLTEELYYLIYES